MEVVLTPLAQLIGFLVVFLIAFHLYRRTADKRLDELSRRLDAAESAAASLDIKSRELVSEIGEIKKKNEDYVKLFKTVVYGFDYIVQGCKSAIGMEAAPGPVEKIISPDHMRRIPEAEGKD